MSQARNKKKFRIAGFRRVLRRSMLAGLRSGVLGLLLRRGTVSCPLIMHLPGEHLLKLCTKLCTPGAGCRVHP